MYGRDPFSLKAKYLEPWVVVGPFLFCFQILLTSVISKLLSVKDKLRGALASGLVLREALTVAGVNKMVHQQSNEKFFFQFLTV